MNGKTKYLKYALHIAILLGLIWAAVKYIDGGEVLEALRNFDYCYLPFMVALALAFFLLKAWRFAVLLAPFSKNVPALSVYKAYISGQAAAMLPGGLTARVGLLKQTGVPISESSVPVAVHSGWDQAIFLLGALIAAFWVPEARIPVLVVVGILIVIGVLLLVRQSREWLADKAERVAARFGHEEQWQRFLAAVPQVFSRRIVLTCILLSITALAVFAVTLYLTLLGFGLSVTIPVLLLSVILPTMLGRIVPVPGGLGVTEASMVGFLTAMGQLDTNTTVAAVAIFRIVTIVFPALLGALVYFFWWRGEEEVAEDVEQTESPKEKETDASPYYL